MHAWTRELLAHLESGREDLRAAVTETPVAARERRPSPSAWSVAEVLSHLARTEGQIAALLQKRSRPLLDGAAPRTLAGEGSVALRFDGAPVLDRAERLAAPAFAAPDPGASLEQAVRKLERARARLVDAVVAVDGLDASGVRQEHHVFGELDLYQWVLFAGFHERRHTAQLREVAAALRG